MLAPASRCKYYFEIYTFCNPEIPELKFPNPGISGLVKRSRIRDPGIAIPRRTVINSAVPSFYGGGWRHAIKFCRPPSALLSVCAVIR